MIIIVVTIMGRSISPESFLEETIKKIGVVQKLIFEKAPNNQFGGSFRVDAYEFFIPTKFSDDKSLEKNKLEKELKYMKGFLASVESKLSNKRFILNAPKDVVAIEKKKVEDAKEKINLIEKSLAGL